MFRLFLVYLSRQSPLPLFGFQKISVRVGQEEEISQWLPLSEIISLVSWEKANSSARVHAFAAGLQSDTILLFLTEATEHVLSMLQGRMPLRDRRLLTLYGHCVLGLPEVGGGVLSHFHWVKVEDNSRRKSAGIQCRWPCHLRERWVTV